MFLDFLFRREGTVFKYRGLDGQKYPVCEVMFFIDGKKDPYKTFMIVDSGADISLIPKTIGEELNLKKAELHYLGGVGGRVGYYTNYVNVQIAGKKFNMPVAWLTHDTVPLLLGRKGVFDKFRICFEERSGEVRFISLF